MAFYVFSLRFELGDEFSGGLKLFRFYNYLFRESIDILMSQRLLGISQNIWLFFVPATSELWVLHFQFLNDLVLFFNLSAHLFKHLDSFVGFPFILVVGGILEEGDFLIWVSVEIVGLEFIVWSLLWDLREV